MAKTTTKPKTQDHKPKQGAKKTVEVQGVKVTLDPDMFDDLIFLDHLDQMDQGNGLRIASVLRSLAGDQFAKVMEVLTDKTTGRVPIEAASAFVTEAMAAVDPNS